MSDSSTKPDRFTGEEGVAVGKFEFRCSFLRQPVEILVDRWGIPHIRAQNLRDLFFAQGFNAARDRLWQIDLWRKRGLGLLARDFGPGYLAQDEASRLFLYRGDMDAEWASYADNTYEISTWFVAGINAFVELTRSRPELLPPEFAVMKTEPAIWSPDDVVRIRSHSLSRNALSEILRSHVLSQAGPKTDGLRSRIEPAVPPEMAARERAASVPVPPLAALQTVALASAPVTFSKERLAATLAEADRWRGTAISAEPSGDSPEGSNNWAVSGERSETGRPLLASDPHRDYGLPSIRYITHLTAPGLDAIGAGEAAVPGISIGHNDVIAFAVTIFGADQEDVYIYETSPDDPSLYRYRDGWEKFDIVSENFAVRGLPDQVRELRFTRHGPVVFFDGTARMAVAVRTVWGEPGSAPYLASLSSMFARDLDTFKAAMRRWGTPSVNQVYADTAGNIAWLPVGLMPRRPNWSGLTPVRGDGAFEWDGFLRQEDMPMLLNPAEGFVATANEMNLPAGWREEHPHIGFEWLEPSRAARIREVLQSAGKHSVESFCSLQTDTLSIPARRLQAILCSLQGEGPAATALELLCGWDCRMDPDSGAALLFDIWWTSHMKPAVLARLAGPVLKQLLSPGDNESILLHLETASPFLGGRTARDALVLETLAVAYGDCLSRFGEVSGWRWGRVHHAYFQHALSTGEPERGWDVGPFEAAGSGSTVRLASYRPEDCRVTHGASVRLVLDVGAWDNSVCINTPGQSGDPRSPHYRDMAGEWAAGGYVPLLFSHARVEEACQARIVLLPDGGIE
ncbi:penicillin acylase family protein [Mesorhizobium sp.]|uniref:penicillin acylase family protein n=1 Tax=Mesorhizobium sp. TaxID=1871066 RepID=UPI0025D5EBBE|nr:penicillin acylase family protein [Mesorhizobium sp.]